MVNSKELDKVEDVVLVDELFEAALLLVKLEMAKPRSMLGRDDVDETGTGVPDPEAVVEAKG